MMRTFEFDAVPLSIGDTSKGQVLTLKRPGDRGESRIVIPATLRSAACAALLSPNVKVTLTVTFDAPETERGEG